MDPGKTYTRRELVKVPTDVSGLFQVVAITNSGETLPERGQTSNNTAVDDATVLVSYPPHPNLRVESITVPDRVDAGSSAGLTFVVRNYGSDAASGNWKDRVYLSLDDRITKDDILVAELFNGSALGQNESYQTTVAAFDIPNRYRGEVFVLVSTDHGDVVEEFDDESDNVRAEPLSVNPLPAADLTISEVSAPTQAFDGTTIEVRYRVKNDGVGATDVQGWTDTLWLTRDKNRPDPGSRDKPQDILLGSFAHEGMLAVDETYEQIVTVTIPEHVSGEWYITPWTDAYDAVLEETFTPNPDDPNELDSNNYRSRPITVLLAPPADLTVTDVQALTPAVGGQPFTVRWTVENQGLEATEDAGWGDKVWLFDGTNNWELGTVAHQRPLGPGQSYTTEHTFQLAPEATGIEVLVETNVVAFPEQPVFEGPYTDNNIGSAPTTGGLKPADLELTSLSAPAASFSGEPIELTWTVTNKGADVWAGTAYWRDYVYVSARPQWNTGQATLVGKFLQANDGSLVTGGSYTRTEEVTLPRGIDGTYYVHVISDPLPIPDAGPFQPRTAPSSNDGNALFYEAHVYEGTCIAGVCSNKANNLATVSLDVEYREPDLRVTEIDLPAGPIYSGDRFGVAWTVVNEGTRDTREKTWIGRVYLSTDASLDKDDLLLGEAGPGDAVPAGESYQASTDVRLPDGISGDYYLLVFTDSYLKRDELRGLIPDGAHVWDPRPRPRVCRRGG